ncbi:MAG: tRNA (adenosine(37)-N6)-threonylcarbamoyltransferase complex ATPase subunit type 1 TsaE, partial [Rhodospirillaceae bacterium]
MSKSLHPLKTVATPPSDASLVQSLADPAATAAFGASLAATCKGLYGGSDGSPATAYAVAIALSGDLGAGKTELARGFARAWTGDPDEEVPSPTFTLVQIYDPPDPALPSLWHFDLYRIEHPDELIALDLEDALAEAICLFEWPDRLGAYCPADHLQIALTHDAQGSGRQARVTATGPNAATLLAGLKTSLQETTAHKKSSPQEPSPGTAQMTDRLALRAAFLAEAGWADVPIRPLAADASFRSYHRLERHPEDPDARRRAVLMDAPPPQEDVRPFRDIAQHLLGLGYSAPAILAQNEVTGFLLLEDFGDATFTRLLATAKAAQRPALEEQLYQSALDLLADLHNRPAASALPKRCPAYDTAKLLEEAALLTDWYLPAVRGMDTQPDVRAEYLNAWHQVLPVLDAVPNTLVL